MATLLVLAGIVAVLALVAGLVLLATRDGRGPAPRPGRAHGSPHGGAAGGAWVGGGDSGCGVGDAGGGG